MYHVKIVKLNIFIHLYYHYVNHLNMKYKEQHKHHLIEYMIKYYIQNGHKKKKNVLKN